MSNSSPSPYAFRSLALVLLGCLALASASSLAQAPTTEPPATPEREAFDAMLDARVMQALAERRARVGALASADAVRAYQQDVATAIGTAVGPLPAPDTPLRARITRSQVRDGYRIEHVLFESQPGYHVTALAYVPDGPGPFPAVLGTAGHSVEGKAHPLYQHAWISLARRGFLVLAYDPPGQGERLEYLDTATGTSSVGVGVPEHVMTGQQLLLTGHTLAASMAHDGRRAVDYLLTRDDVDPARLAVAGNSGGGTQAALLAALEPRLSAIVASCYMTSWEQLWRGPGPQDAEQILPGFLAAQLDFADFALAAAPRGFLVSSAIQDYFPIAGARACHTELRRLYGVLGAGDRVAMVENDAPHGWSQPLREGAYRWLRTWLNGPSAPDDEAPLTPDDPETLRVTTTGQLATSVGSRTTRALNVERADALADARPPATPAALAAVVQLPDSRPPARVVTRQAVPGTDGRERLIVEVEPGVRLVGILRQRAAGTSPTGTALVIDERGIGHSTAADALVAAGRTVLALDVRGTGDMAPRAGASGYAGAYQFAARAWLLGTSVVAWQVRDVLAGLDVLRTEAPDARSTVVHAHGQTAPAALWAAQVEPLDTLVLSNSLVSYHDLVAADQYQDASLMIVPGVLRVTDLPMLMTRVASTRVELRGPVRPDGQAATTADVTRLLGGRLPPHVLVVP